jgi:hypothetical protein
LVLADEGHVTAQVGEASRPEIDVVEAECAGGRIIEPQHQRE